MRGRKFNRLQPAEKRGGGKKIKFNYLPKLEIFKVLHMSNIKQEAEDSEKNSTYSICFFFLSLSRVHRADKHHPDSCFVLMITC